MIAILDEIFSAQLPISVSVQFVEAAEHYIKVLIREVLRHLYEKDRERAPAPNIRLQSTKENIPPNNMALYCLAFGRACAKEGR